MKLKHTSIKLRLVLKKIYLEIRKTHLKDLRNLILKYIKKLPDIVHLRNLVFFSSLMSIIILVLFVQRFSALSLYYQKVSPDFGGVYREGVIGNIEKINPLFALNTAEESADKLVFSGLTRVLKNNEVVPDLAENWKKIDDRTYDFNLRKNVKWHDGEPFNADDVVFTITAIQNPDTKTAENPIWKDVKVEKVNEFEVKFTLPNSYSDFPAVASQAVLPKHALDSIDPKNIKVAQFNLNPIGTGPYKFVRFDQGGDETEVVFTANDNFVLGKPYIKEVRLRMYENFGTLYNGFIRKQIDGITEIPYDKISRIEKASQLDMHKFYLPRYVTLLFNQKNENLATKEVRAAISKAIDRKKVIDEAVYGQAISIYSGILPGQVGYDKKLRVETYNKAAAESELEKLGWLKAADGIRAKGGKQLIFNLVLPDDDESKEAADVIATELSEIGVKTNLVVSDPELIQSNYVRPRNYDMILIGQDVGISPDLYSFWHSSQVNDPGLNLTGFKSKKVDTLLALARKSNDKKYVGDRYIEVQEEISATYSAVFLYNPIYAMAVNQSVKGLPDGKLNRPVDHLNNIYTWYIKEKISY